MSFAVVRLRRSPIAAVGLMIFSLVLSAALCALHAGSRTAQVHYDEICREIQVKCTVTSLTGDQSENLYIPNTVFSQFTGEIPQLPAELKPFVEDVQLKGSRSVVWQGEECTLAGITSLQAEKKLSPENGCTIFWEADTGEEIFRGDTVRCLIPQELKERMEDLACDSLLLTVPASVPEGSDYVCSLTVAGTYQGGDGETIYCSWESYKSILAAMGEYASADALSATLRDNNDLDAFREAAAAWFSQPDPNANAMDWGTNLALDINDSQLMQARLSLENSMKVSAFCAVLVFLLSAGAGFLIGFLMIRARRREIALMRTMGTPTARIYSGYALEQMLLSVLGIAIGGAYFLWRPVWQLALFAGIYFLGLSAALLIFLRKNLLTAIKEEE